MHKCYYVYCLSETSNPKYCSLSCGAKQQQLNAAANKVKVYRSCARNECVTSFEITKFTKKNIYCSHTCAAIVSNSTRTRKDSRAVKHCVCGKTTKSIYCSSFCAAKAKSDAVINSWLIGEFNGDSKQGLSSAIRKYLISKAGNKCTNPNCAVPGGFASINPVTGKVPLEVDHIDGNHQNNRPENLIVLCPNCHALTPTYKALNKGSGRAYRGKYNQYATINN